MKRKITKSEEVKSLLMMNKRRGVSLISKSHPIDVSITPQEEEAMSRINEIQIGGDHYKKQTLQPWDAITEWGLDFLAGNVVKYVVRHKDKGGIEDLKKARHYLDKLIEVEVTK